MWKWKIQKEKFYYDLNFTIKKTLRHELNQPFCQNTTVSSAVKITQSVYAVAQNYKNVKALTSIMDTNFVKNDPLITYMTNLSNELKKTKAK